MLLNYLYQHFYEEEKLAEILDIDTSHLQGLIRKRLFPKPSYILGPSGEVVSFVANYRDNATYHFHLKASVQWFDVLSKFELDSEERAKAYFINRYNLAKRTFFSSKFALELVAESSIGLKTFDQTHMEMTWSYFLDGVYGVCTRDGSPESIFQKQVGVMFVEGLTQDGPQALSSEKHKLLSKIIDFLDRVESDFAPHEVAQTSRQRCITDIRKVYFAKGIE